jgi:fatty acid synthase subunit alpha, fungi type
LEAGATLELSARFLGFVADSINDEPQSKSARLSLLFNVFRYFIATYLSNNGIHTAASSHNNEVRQIVLSSYFRTLSSLNNQNVLNVPRGPLPNLFSDVMARKASIYALFGGQGTNEVYLDELQFFYDSLS